MLMTMPGRALLPILAGCCVALLSACFQPEGDDPGAAGSVGGAGSGSGTGGAGGALEGRVEVGVPDEIRTLLFEELVSGGDIPLESFGQGGTHASLAIRCVNFGDRAFVKVTIENLDADGMTMTSNSVRPSLLLCPTLVGLDSEEKEAALQQEHVCDLIPMIVMTGGLSGPIDLDDLHVQVTAEVQNEDGLSASASMDGYLRRR